MEKNLFLLPAQQEVASSFSHQWELKRFHPVGHHNIVLHRKAFHLQAFSDSAEDSVGDSLNVFANLEGQPLPAACPVQGSGTLPLGLTWTEHPQNSELGLAELAELEHWLCGQSQQPCLGVAESPSVQVVLVVPVVEVAAGVHGWPVELGASHRTFHKFGHTSPLRTQHTSA